MPLFLLKLLFILYIAAMLVIRRLVGELARSEKKEQQTGIENNWKWRFQNIPNKFFGHGCHYPFEHYLSGSSAVEIKTLDELCDWLTGCQYVSDYKSKGVRDHWSHPDEFELSRNGDCEDFALWTWRKLKEMKLDADFTVGKWLQADGRAGSHAWVVLHHADEKLIIETTGRNRQRIIKPLDRHMSEYIPFAAVDTRLRKKVYNGILTWLWKIREEMKA